MGKTDKTNQMDMVSASVHPADLGKQCRRTLARGLVYKLSAFCIGSSTIQVAKKENLHSVS